MKNFIINYFDLSFFLYYQFVIKMRNYSILPLFVLVLLFSFIFHLILYAIFSFILFIFEIFQLAIILIISLMKAVKFYYEAQF
jgi:hypothetical protein